MTAIGLAASAASKNGNGGLGLVVVAVLAVVMFFLFRSMVKHLRKAQRMEADPVDSAAPTTTLRSEERPEADAPGR